MLATRTEKIFTCLRGKNVMGGRVVVKIATSSNQKSKVILPVEQL